MLFSFLNLDYEESIFDLTFNEIISSASVPIGITNDDAVEISEYFNGQLLATDSSAVVTDPDIATIVITEDSSDSKAANIEGCSFYF